MVTPGRRFLLFIAIIMAIGGVAFLASANAPRGPSASPSPYFAWFGLIALGLLWIASSALSGEWNPLALAMGADNRLSTSKFQLLAWTACIGFVYAMVYADRIFTQIQFLPITSIPNNVLIALGISVTTAVAASAITGSQVSANPNNKDIKDSPSYDPAALVRNDGAPTASLNKVQILFWTSVAIIVYLVTAFHQLGDIVTCNRGICGFPDIDATLMLFMGLGHASYLGGKLASGTTPALTSVSDDDENGVKTITLTGTNLGSTGSIIIDGQVRDDVPIISWTPNSVKFVFPESIESQYSAGQKVALAVSVNGVPSPPITYVYTSPTAPAAPSQNAGTAATAPTAPAATTRQTRGAAPKRPTPPAATNGAVARLAGIDVSYCQGDRIDWDAVKSQKLAQFVYSRASFGANPVNNDPNFTRNHDECKRIGIPFGAYHFFLFDEAGVTQAHLFLQQINGREGNLCPMVDVEEGSRPTGDTQQMIQNLSSFVDQIQRELDCKPIIYTNQNTWDTHLDGTDSFSGHRLWIANLNDDANRAPALPRGFRDWTIYQYSANGKLPTLDGGLTNVDLDVLKAGIDITALTRTPPKRAVAISTALSKVVFDGPNKKLRAVDANGKTIFQCEARNVSVAANAWRPYAGCPPGTYTIAAPESNDLNRPCTEDNDWIGEGRWFIPITGIPGHEGIGIHGGGTCKTPPEQNALIGQQGWCPTENCIRLQNQDLATFAALPITGKSIEVVQPTSA